MTLREREEITGKCKEHFSPHDTTESGSSPLTTATVTAAPRETSRKIISLPMCFLVFLDKISSWVLASRTSEPRHASSAVCTAPARIDDQRKRGPSKHGPTRQENVNCSLRKPLFSERRIHRERRRERERAQLAAAAGGEGEVRKEGGQAKWSLPHGHIAFRVEKEKRGGGLEEMDSLKEEGKAFPSYFFLFASKASEGVALTPDLGCANDGPTFRATL